MSDRSRVFKTLDARVRVFQMGALGFEVNEEEGYCASQQLTFIPMHSRIDAIPIRYVCSEPSTNARFGKESNASVNRKYLLCRSVEHIWLSPVNNDAKRLLFSIYTNHNHNATRNLPEI